MILVASVMESLSDSQIISIAETILRKCSRDHAQRPLSDANKLVFDKLVAGYHHDIHEMGEISEALIPGQDGAV
jgi:hypothetical protein